MVQIELSEIELELVGWGVVWCLSFTGVIWRINWELHQIKKIRWAGWSFYDLGLGREFS